MHKVAAQLDRLRQRGEKALIPYITAGFPSRDDLLPLLTALARGGADVIEVGVPFSDPIADGLIIQKSSHAALANGTRLPWILAEIAQARALGVTVPILLMGYCNPFLSFGIERLANAAAVAGIDGLIVPDLPTEHAEEWLTALQPRGLGIAFIAAPTTNDQRLLTIGAKSSGFVYCVSTNGVTGIREHVAAGLAALVRRVKAATELPVAVGFGISTPAHVYAVTRDADAAIVGSALIRLIAETPKQTRIAAVERFIGELKAATYEELYS